MEEDHLNSCDGWFGPPPTELQFNYSSRVWHLLSSFGEPVQWRWWRDSETLWAPDIIRAEDLRHPWAAHPRRIVLFPGMGLPKCSLIASSTDSAMGKCRFVLTSTRGALFIKKTYKLVTGQIIYGWTNSTDETNNYIYINEKHLTFFKDININGQVTRKL